MMDLCEKLEDFGDDSVSRKFPGMLKTVMPSLFNGPLYVHLTSVSIKTALSMINMTLMGRNWSVLGRNQVMPTSKKKKVILQTSTSASMFSGVAVPRSRCC